MSWIDFFRRPRAGSADMAKERLQILLAHERVDRDGPDYLPMLQKDIIAAIAKYLPVDNDKVDVRLERGRDVSTLEVDIELPGAAKLGDRARRPTAFGTPATAQ